MRALIVAPALVGAAACGGQADASHCHHQVNLVSVDVTAPGQKPPTPYEEILPKLTGRVVDEAGLISAEDESLIASRSAALEKATSDQVVVATLTSLGGRRLEDVSLQLAREWGIGQKGLDNGVVLVVAPNERRARIEVGCGLEGLLTDEKAQAIMDDEIIPRFADGRFEEGIVAGVAAIDALLRRDTRRPQPNPKRGEKA